MPMTFLEAPAGIQADAKQRLVAALTAALKTAYADPHDDYRIFLREYAATNIGQNGMISDAPVGPVYFIEGPPLPDIEARKVLIAELHAAIAAAYWNIANTAETMILINEYPLENAGSGGRLASEDAAIVAATVGREALAVTAS